MKTTIANHISNRRHSMSKYVKIFALSALVTLASCGKEDMMAPAGDSKNNTEVPAPVQKGDEDNVLNAISDNHFRAYVEDMMARAWDADGDGKLSQAEAAAVKSVTLPVGGEIESLQGIEYFTGITYLSCVQNKLRSLDLSYNTFLTGVTVDGNDLVSLYLPYTSTLTMVTCEDNELRSLDLSGLTALTDLRCGANQLTALEVSHCKNLGNLECWGNLIDRLDVSGLTRLNILNCQVNEMHELVLGGNVNLTQLSALACLLEGIDISDSPKIWMLSIEDNPGLNGVFTVKMSVEVPKGKIPGRDYNYYFPTEWVRFGENISANYVR